MKIVVDLAVCQGYAQCAFLAPEAFRLNGEEALLYGSVMPGVLPLVVQKIGVVEELQSQKASATHRLPLCQ